MKMFQMTDSSRSPWKWGEGQRLDWRKTEDKWTVDVSDLESVFHHVGERERESLGLPAMEESIWGILGN